MRTFFLREISNLKSNLPSTGLYPQSRALPYHPIRDFVADSLYQISLSILSGKYIVDDIEAFCIEINLELDSFEFDFPHFIHLKKYLDIIREGLNRYLNFYENIKNIYGLKLIDFRSFNRSQRLTFQSEIKLLDLNIKLNLLDNNFTSDREVLIKLFSIKNELGNLSLSANFSEIHNALVTKVNFLIYKWYLRTAQKEGNIEYSSLLIDLRRQISSGVFNPWIEKMLNHYEIPGEDWKGYFHQVNNLITGNNINLTFLEINNKIKYQKDVIKNEENLKTLLDDIESRVNSISGLSELEKVSHYLLLNYAINNYFSIFCDKKYEKFKLLKEKGDKKIIEKCKIIIDDILFKYHDLVSKFKGKTNNFFLDFKVSLFCIKILNEAYGESSNKVLFIETFDEDVNTAISDILSNYKKKKEWSLLNNNYIFKLSYNESILNHNNVQVYYASSFTLAKIDDDVEERFEEVYNLFKDLKLRFTLKYEIETIHSLTDEFKKENKRIIEVVTVFTAIISFIVGSIGAFQFLSTFRQSLIFLLCYSIAISLFVILMYIANSKLNMHRDYIGNRKFKLLKDNSPLYTFEYPVVNYRLIRNVIVLLITYSFLFGLLYFLFSYDENKNFIEVKTYQGVDKNKDDKTKPLKILNTNSQKQVEKANGH